MRGQSLGKRRNQGNKAKIWLVNVKVAMTMNYLLTDFGPTENVMFNKKLLDINQALPDGDIKS
jgi:hypothetical protein